MFLYFISFSTRGRGGGQTLSGKFHYLFLFFFFETLPYHPHCFDPGLVIPSFHSHPPIFFINSFPPSSISATYKNTTFENPNWILNCSTMSKLDVMRVEKFLSTQHLRRTTERNHEQNRRIKVFESVNVAD